MSTEFPSSWTDPDYVSTIVVVLATAAVIFYTALTPAGPTVQDVIVVVLAITLPLTVAREIAHRRG